MDILEKKLSETGNPTICPTAVVFNKGKILIGFRNYTTDKWKNISVWTFPGGRCDEGEKIEIALRREVEEETGIIELVITEFFGQIPGAKEGDVVYVFKVETKEEPKLLEPQKFSKWKWSYLSEIPKNFINPEALKLIKQ